jgi:G3E family GTPase
LGAGKTTLINNILSNATQRIAVVVNDFGSVNIDAALISARHEDTIELTNGCICCSVGESLADVLFSLLEREALPELVVIEASGVADPSAISAYAHIDGFHLHGNIVLVDAVHAIETSQNELVARTFTRQIAAAQLIVLSKTDAVTTSEITEVRNLITSIAPQIPVIQAAGTSLSQLLVAETPNTTSNQVGIHSSFSTTTLEHVSAKDESQLRAFINNFPSTVVRAKGVVEIADGTRLLIQKVGNTVTISETALPTSGLVVISAEPFPQASQKL